LDSSRYFGGGDAAGGPKCRTYSNAWAEQILKLDDAGISLTYVFIGDLAGLRATSYKILRNNSHTLNPKEVYC